MLLAFPFKGYENIAPVKVPEANLSGIYESRFAGEIDEDDVLAKGFAEPIGAKRLRDEIKRDDRVLILPGTMAFKDGAV